VFHAQQCAEKYLKARLEEAAIGFARTHDLLMLHQLALPVEPNWQVLQTPLAFLNPCRSTSRVQCLPSRSNETRGVMC
jgi:HEPN domain-containing protein